VFMTILDDGVLALGKGVPQLDRLVARSGHDLSVIGGESNRKNVLLVIFETTCALAGVQIPEAEMLVPGAGQSIVPIRGHDDIGNEVSMTVKTPLGNAVASLFALEIPEDQGLVSR